MAYMVAGDCLTPSSAPTPAQDLGLACGRSAWPIPSGNIISANTALPGCTIGSFSKPGPYPYVYLRACTVSDDGSLPAINSVVGLVLGAIAIVYALRALRWAVS